MNKASSRKLKAQQEFSLAKPKFSSASKSDLGEPFPDTPNEGVLTVNAELVPVASPSFEPGPPDENSIELARVVDRGIRESKCIDNEKLCIEPGKKVFVVFVDIYVLNHDGNLIDASAIAAMAALMNTKMPNYEIKDGELKIKQGYTPLPLKSHPITVTIGKINNKLITDPIAEEEQVMESRITFATKEDGTICAIQKGGSGYFTPQQILEASKIALDKAAELRKKLDW